MDVYKEYLYKMSKIEYQSPYLIVMLEYPPPLFKHYIPMILNVPFVESTCTAYYGDIRKICYSFFHRYSNCILSAMKGCERYLKVLSYPEMMQLFDNTVKVHNANHKMVLHEFQPTHSEREKEQLNEIIYLHNNYMTELMEFGHCLSFLRKESDRIGFTKDHIEICVKRVNQMGEFTREFTAKLIAERLHLIRTSLKDLLHQITQNSITFRATYDKVLHHLFGEMYDRNKDRLNISRWEHTSCSAIVEVDKKIETVKNKIADFGNEETFSRLDSETEYWTTKLRHFEEIATVITKVKAALERAKDQLAIHERHKCTNLPGDPQTTCWDVIGENYRRHIEDLEIKYNKVCIPIYTFFVCKGIDRAMYKDANGMYYVDEYGHKIYTLDFGVNNYHVNCKGEVIMNRENNNRYYFNECGRYTIINGEQIYQLTPTAYEYRLNDQGLFEECTPCICNDECCNMGKRCLMNSIVRSDVELLPKTEPVNIERTLDAETVKYLWDAIGYFLPEVLYEVTETYTTNPILQIAHVLVNKKYNMTPEQIREKKRQAKEYRSQIHKEREKKEPYQTKRCKPQIFDSTFEEQAYFLQEEQ